MKTSSRFPEDQAIQEIAANWVVRRDGGLSAADSVEFERWLAADSRHAEAVKRVTGTWGRLDHISESAARAVLEHAARRRNNRRRLLFMGALPAAAGFAVLIWFGVQSPSRNTVQVIMADSTNGPRQLTLSDGSVVELNHGGQIQEQFTAEERRVILVSGEAFFSVTKNPARPFIVRADRVDVRAVGTAFNVHLESAAVEVFVSEGVVKVNPAAGEEPKTPTTFTAIPALTAGQRAIVALTPTAPEVAVVVTTMSAEEISHSLAWQEPIFRLGGATLAEVVANFSRRTGKKVVLADPSLGTMRLGGRFRADDLEGFASVLSATLAIEVEHAPDGTLILRKKTSTSL